jgi:hypothetical protein
LLSHFHAAISRIFSFHRDVIFAAAFLIRSRYVASPATPRRAISLMRHFHIGHAPPLGHQNSYDIDAAFAITFFAAMPALIDFALICCDISPSYDFPFMHFPSVPFSHDAITSFLLQSSSERKARCLCHFD